MLSNPKLNKLHFILFCSIIGLYVLLYFVWYKAQFAGNFHFFDDSHEWLGMDKGGHFITAFVESWILIEWFKIIYINNNETLDWKDYRFFLFGLSGFFLQLPIEFMDGYSQGYGFSWYDILANLVGALAAWLQYLFWGKIKIYPKVSFFPSAYASLRPNLLGSNLIEQFIKDYNALTFWYSFSPNIFFKKPIFPNWFNIAIGYGADGLLGGHDNIWTDNLGNVSDYSCTPRVVQCYISLDINIEHFQFENKYLKWGIKIFNVIKVPIPAMLIN